MQEPDSLKHCRHGAVLTPAANDMFGERSEDGAVNRKGRAVVFLGPRNQTSSCADRYAAGSMLFAVMGRARLGDLTSL